MFLLLLFNTVNGEAVERRQANKEANRKDTQLPSIYQPIGLHESKSKAEKRGKSITFLPMHADDS